MRKFLAIIIFIFFIGMCINPSTGTIVEKTTIIDSKFNGYIQDLIDNASDGDTINIPSGTYYENITIDKSINLIGEDKDTTFIIGNDQGDIIYVSADWVNISGFTIQSTIQSNIMERFFPEAIQIDSNYNTISGNIISYTAGNGIELGYSNGNIITDNLIWYNGLWGIVSSYSFSNTITGNNITNNGEGICVSGSINSPNYNNTISGNNITNNYAGILIGEYTNNDTIKDNIISNNYYGIEFHGESIINNIIYHNNFINNTYNAAKDSGDNIWDNGYPSGGNYWDDYNGTDSDGDGIGDTPYPIPGGDNEDRYPLGNFYPDKPDIDGPSSGKPNTKYDFTFNSTDPEDDDILEYIVDWGDDTGEETISGPFNSGEEATGSHTWASQDTFTIKAKAKDVFGAESNWTYFDVEIETARNRPVYHSLLSWLFERFPLLEKLVNFL